jgi:hypothetical protein
VNSIQVKNSWESGREDRERERDIADWGERERMKMVRENGVGFKRRSALGDFDQWSKSTPKYYCTSQIALSTQRYFDTW